MKIIIIFCLILFLNPYLYTDVTLSEEEAYFCTNLASNWSPELIRSESAKAGFNINNFYKTGKTPLMYASAVNKSPELIREFIKNGADVNLKSQGTGYTALMMASAFSKSNEILKTLISAGANINDADTDGDTALMTALFHSQPAVIINTLISAGASTGITNKNKISPVHAALYAKYPSEDNIRALVNGGASVNGRDSKGNSPLLLALSMKDYTPVGICKILITAGASVNDKNADGDTPIIIEACKYNYSSEILSLLISYGADVNVISSKTGETPLLAIADHGNPDILKKLIKAGADVNLRTKSGYTPLLLSVIHCDADSAKEFISAKADLNARDPKGMTALMHASNYCDPLIVEMLLESGADPNLRSNDGWTALMYAAYQPKTDTDASGMPRITGVLNPFENYFIFIKWKKIINTLLNSGSDVKIKNNNGETAYDLVKKALSGYDSSVVENVASSDEYRALKNFK